MALKSQNILALLTQIARDRSHDVNLDDSLAFQELVGSERSWNDIFEHIDSISDVTIRHKLRGIEFDYTLNFVKTQMQLLIPRSANDVWALERSAFLTGLFSNAFNLWDEYCAALDILESDLRQALEERGITVRKVRSHMHDIEFVRELIATMNYVIFEKTGLSGEEGALARVESHSAQLVLCEHVAGIPLSLAVIYLVAGARLGFPLHGVNTPGRFILKWQYDDLEIFVDVFDKGTLVTRHDLEMLIQANIAGFSPRLLDAAPFEIIARRSLANLTALAMRNEDSDRARKLEALSRSLFGF